MIIRATTCESESSVAAELVGGGIRGRGEGKAWEPLGMEKAYVGTRFTLRRHLVRELALSKHGVQCRGIDSPSGINSGGIFLIILRRWETVWAVRSSGQSSCS